MTDAPSPQDSRAAEDEQLVNRLRSGDADALNQLSLRYWEPIRRFAAEYLGGDDALAADVAQETLAKLANPEHLPDAAVRPWLYKIARNRCLDILRRHQRSPTHDHRVHTRFDATASSAGPGTKAAAEERRELIRSIIQQMPDEYRSVLILKFYEGLSREEMAEALAVSEATVKGRLVRASEYLEQELRKITGSA